MATQLETERGILRVPTGTWTVDPVHSSIEFRVKHMMISTVRGRFRDFEGTIEAAPDYHDSSVQGSIDAASIDTNDERRDGHLRSADFFDVEHHPAATFSARASGWQGTTGVLAGELTLRGVTRPVSLQAEYLGYAADPWGGHRVVFTAAGTVDREDWGLTWNLPLDGGGLVVSREIRIEIELEAVLQP
jgi:polyisoprenoid-binding protein YceI